MTSIWKEPFKRDDRATVSIMLPSGVTVVKGGVRVEIEEESTLKITVKWPTAMTDIKKILRVLIYGTYGTKIHTSHPMVGGFFDALHDARGEKNAAVESFARITLPFSVLPKPVNWMCAYKGTSAVILLVTVDVPASAFTAVEDMPIFVAKRTSGMASTSV